MSNARDEFLDWYSSLSAKESDEICTVTAYEIWKQAWQASREALVVELPPEWEDVCDKVMDAQSVKSALDAAGVSYE